MRVTTLSDKVLERLGRDIVSGVYPPGKVLRIEDLQATFGVSRTVIRDVVSQLDSLNLTRTRPRVGVRVCEPQEWNVFAPDVVHWRLTGSNAAEQLRSLSQLRASVEPQAAELAARRADGELGNTLLALAEQMADRADPGDLDGFLAADLRFHALILRNCGNEMFAALEGPIAEALRARHEQHLVPTRPRDIAVLLHQLVATGIRDGEVEATGSAMRQLVAEAGVVRQVPDGTASS